MLLQVIQLLELNKVFSNITNRVIILLLSVVISGIKASKVCLPVNGGTNVCDVVFEEHHRAGQMSRAA